MTEFITTPINKITVGTDENGNDLFAFKVFIKTAFTDSPEVRLDPQGTLTIEQIDRKISDITAILTLWNGIKTTAQEL